MAPKTLLPVNPKVNDKWYNIRRFMGEKTQENLQMGYSAAYPTGAERSLMRKKAKREEWFSKSLNIGLIGNVKI